MKKRLVSFLVSLVMALSLFPSAYAVDKEDDTENPLLWTIPARHNLGPTEERGSSSGGAQNDEGYSESLYRTSSEEYITFREAAKLLAEYMRNRKSGFSLKFYMPKDDFITRTNTWEQLLDEATPHTGEPTGGDYIRNALDTYGYDSFVVEIINDVCYCSINDLKLFYFTTAEEEARLDVEIERVMEELSLDNKTDYEKIYIVYKYICDNVRYNHDAANAVENGSFTVYEDYRHTFSAYGALVNGDAVCQGYATLLYRMLLECGIDNRVVLNSNHAFNIISLDDTYYNADSTWDRGLTDYSWFLKGAVNFYDYYHIGLSGKYLTAEFINKYPVSAIDYTERNLFIGNDETDVIASGICGESLNWELNASGTLSIRGTGAMNQASGIEADLWGGHKAWIKEIVIEEGVTSIGDYAFANCVALESVSLPDTLVNIGERAFVYCERLTEVAVPNSVENIGAGAFAICLNLKSIKLPHSLTSLSDELFNHCMSLETLEIPASVTSLGRMTFNFAFPDEGEHSLIIPNSVTSVGEGCFMYTGLEKVVWPESATRIENMMFYHSYNLREFEIPSTVTYLGSELFSHCSGLEIVEIPSSVTTVEHGLFYACEKLTKVTLSERMTCIPSSMFESCFSLRTIEIPKGVETIGSSAFDRSGIQEISLPEGLETIESTAFMRCNKLVSIVFPQNVSRIEDYSFAWCTALNEIEFLGDAPVIENRAFNGISAIANYPADNATWTNDIKQDYGGSLTWTSEGEADPNPDMHTHQYTSEVISPTCTVDGYTTHNCACGDSYTDSIVAAAGHKWDDGKVTKEPTEDAEGTKTFTCTVCGETVTETIPALDHAHKYTDKVTAPTCTEEGYTTHTCSCGDSYIDSAVAATGHKWDSGKVTQEPTTTAEGEKTFTCTVCKEIKTEKIDTLPDNPKPLDNPFTDVSEKDYYFEPVMWAMQNGVTSGLSADTFGPAVGCTRAQVVTFLWRAAGEPAPESSENPFKDVKEGVYYYDAVLWAVENGITAGLSADAFGPDANCNRGQIVTFLWRANGKPTSTSDVNPFKDVDKAMYYYDAVLWAVENGITAGLSADSFGPDATCTRGQIVTFLYRNYK